MENPANLGGNQNEPDGELPLDPFVDDEKVREMVILLGSQQPGPDMEVVEDSFSILEEQFNAEGTDRGEPDIEAMVTAFNILTMLDSRESLTLPMLSEFSGPSVAIATSDKVARDAREIVDKLCSDVSGSNAPATTSPEIETSFYSRVSVPEAYCDTLAVLAKISALNDDIGSVKQYCKILEVMPFEVSSIALITAYYAAIQLGDTEIDKKLNAMLTKENDNRFTKISEYPGYIFNQGEDRALLSAIVRECALQGGTGSQFIERHTILKKSDDSRFGSKESEVVDEESRWSLYFAQLQFRKKKEGTNTTGRDIDRMLNLLLDDEINDLSPSYVWAVIPDAYISTDDTELRYTLIKKFLENTLHITAPGTIVIERLLSLGNSVIEDEELIEARPNSLTEVDNTLSLTTRSLQSGAGIEVKNALDEIYKGFHTQVLIREGLSAGEVLDYINLEHQKKMASNASELSGLGESEPLEKVIGIAETAKYARNYLLSLAAVQFATYGDYSGSQLIISEIKDTDVRLHTYATSWAHAESVSDVVTMAPDEILSDITGDEDPEEPAISEPILEELYETAKVVSSNDLVQMAKRVSLLIPRINKEVIAGETVNIGTDTRQLQLNMLIEKMSKIDPIIGRNAALQLMSSRLHGNQRYNTNHMQQSTYDAMIIDLDGRFLSAVRTGIIRVLTEPWEVRASRLANYALKLRKQAMAETKD